MKKFLLFCLAFILLATATSICSFSAVQGETRGNSIGNISNSGCVAVSSKQVYISASTVALGLYSIDKSSGRITKICADSADNLNIVGDSLFCRFYAGNYAYPNTNLGFYEVKLDDSEIRKLSSDNASCIQIVDGWIYYINETDSRKVYKMKLDGTENKKIMNQSVRFISVSGNWIYFQAERENMALCRVKTDGSGLAELNICKTPIMYVNIVGNTIYYMTESPIAGLYCINTDGTKKTLLYRGKVSNMNVSNGLIYYNDPGRGIYSMNVDGTKKTVIIGFASLDKIKLHISDGWIYYDNGYSVRRAKLDGSADQEFLYHQIVPASSSAPIMEIKRGKWGASSAYGQLFGASTDETLQTPVERASNLMSPTPIPTSIPTPTPKSIQAPTPEPLPSGLTLTNETSSDGLKIYDYKGIMYVEVNDIIPKYYPNCLIIIYLDDNRADIFNTSFVTMSGSNKTIPILQTNNVFLLDYKGYKGYYSLFKLEYYESTIKPLLVK